MSGTTDRVSVLSLMAHSARTFNDHRIVITGSMLCFVTDFELSPFNDSWQGFDNAGIVHAWRCKTAGVCSFILKADRL